MHIDVRPLLRRILMVGLPLAATGCPCPEPDIGDQIFLLDSRVDGGLVDESGGDGGVAAGSMMDKNCFPLAMGCSTDGNCLPACECVLSRAKIPYSKIQSCKLLAGDAAPSVHALYTSPAYCPGGRRPGGYTERPVSLNAVASYLTRLAELEAASILAFDILTVELSAHHAPDALVRRARLARQDEARHWRLMRAAAVAHGGQPRAPRLGRPRGPRRLQAVLHENAVEGCVNETYGALLARFQSASAQDPTLRNAFALIADDEADHAQLAWDVDHWGRDLLSAADRQRLDCARNDAAQALSAAVSAPVDALLHQLAGVPSPTTAVAMVTHARTLLWA